MQERTTGSQPPRSTATVETGVSTVARPDRRQRVDVAARRPPAQLLPGDQGTDRCRGGPSCRWKRGWAPRGAAAPARPSSRSWCSRASIASAPRSPCSASHRSTNTRWSRAGRARTAGGRPRNRRRLVEEEELGVPARLYQRRTSPPPNPRRHEIQRRPANARADPAVAIVQTAPPRTSPWSGTATVSPTGVTRLRRGTSAGRGGLEGGDVDPAHLQHRLARCARSGSGSDSSSTAGRGRSATTARTGP